MRVVRIVPLGLLCGVLANAVIIDRIAIVVNNAIIKDSDIDRDLRVTDLLNSQHLILNAASRKEAANRLIDQVFIRREIDVGGYPTATLEDADKQLDKLKSERFRSEASFEQVVKSYGLNALDLRTEFQWQLTVLRFVDTRFRPGAIVTDQELQGYYDQHQAELRRANPGKTSLEDLRPEIQETLAGEKVNQQFFAWLDEQRKQAKITYREDALR